MNLRVFRSLKLALRPFSGGHGGKIAAWSMGEEDLTHIAHRHAHGDPKWGAGTAVVVYAPLRFSAQNLNTESISVIIDRLDGVMVRTARIRGAETKRVRLGYKNKKCTPCLRNEPVERVRIAGSPPRVELATQQILGVYILAHCGILQLAFVPI